MYVFSSLSGFQVACWGLKVFFLMKIWWVWCFSYSVFSLHRKGAQYTIMVNGSWNFTSLTKFIRDLQILEFKMSVSECVFMKLRVSGMENFCKKYRNIVQRIVQCKVLWSVNFQKSCACFWNITKSQARILKHASCWLKKCRENHLPLL